MHGLYLMGGVLDHILSFAYDNCFILLSDIDECTTGTNMCHQEATCMNTDGGYTCTCNNRYTGDGMECSGK